MKIQKHYPRTAITKALSFFLFFSLFSSSIANAKVSCFKDSLNKLKDQQFLFVGENHFSYTSKKFLEKHSSSFKKLGFETVFVEYIPSKNQKILDHFNSESKEHAKPVYRAFAQPGDWGYDSDAYWSLTKALRHHHLEVRGLDLRASVFDLIDRGEDSHLSTSDRLMALRDRHMFKVASDYIAKFPNKKIIFFNGWSHSYLNRKLARPSFYELFKSEFPAKRALNIKIDHFEWNYISNERFYMNENKPDFRCRKDFYSLEGHLNDFSLYIFEDTDEFLPIADQTTFL